MEGDRPDWQGLFALIALAVIAVFACSYAGSRMLRQADPDYPPLATERKR